MEKFQVQFVVGVYTVNHIVEGESKEHILDDFTTEWINLKASRGAQWMIEDTAIDPNAITLIRVLPYQEKVEEKNA